MTLSRHAGSSPIRDRFTSAPFDLPTLFRAGRSPTFHRRRWPRARPPFTRTATLFGALRTSVFEARRRLTTSATATTCEHFDPDSRLLEGTTAATVFLFSRTARFPLRGTATRVEPRSVRSPRPRCRFLPLAWVYPTAMPMRARDRPTVSRRSVEPRLTCTGLRTEQRTRHLVRVRCDALASVAHAFLGVDRRRSPPRRTEEHPLSPVSPHASEEPLRT
jgi:hypothetical protein